MLRYGIISEVDYSAGRARVNEDELDIVTDWLTLPKDIKENKIYDVNTQVAFLIHENGEDGEILHTVPCDTNKPPEWANDHVEGFEFHDGTKVTYDNSTKTLTIDAGTTGELIFNCVKLTVSGDVIAGVEKISLINHLHTSPVGPTGKPIPIVI